MPQAVRLAGLGVGLERGDARSRLDDAVVGGPVGVRPGRPESGHRHHDHVRIDPAEVLVGHAEALGDTGAEVLEDDVGTGGQFEHDGAAISGRDIDGGGPLGAVGHLVDARDPADGRPDVTQHVSRSRWFDLDHVRALLGEDSRRQRRSQRRCEVQHPHAGQRRGIGAGTLPLRRAPGARRLDSGRWGGLAAHALAPSAENHPSLEGPSPIPCGAAGRRGAAKSRRGGSLDFRR